MTSSASKDLRSQVAELIVVRASGHCSDRERRYPQWELSNSELKALLRDGIGGVILLGGSCTELWHRCNTLKNWAVQPLLLCADVEEGVGQRFDGGTWLVPPLALGLLYKTDQERAITLAEHYGRCTGHEAQACGLNWVLAPVCDVNNNPANPVINVRAWGEDPSTVSALACAFHRGLKETGVLGCAKHFPGHGDTTVDSHLDLPVLDHSLERLEQLELKPFEALIKDDIASVMTAHLLMKSLDSQQPATLSSHVIKQLLRNQLGYNGLVVTDALVMEAITKRYDPAEAAVQAFCAGSDLILMPADANAAIDGLCHAIQSGRIPLEDVKNSQQRRRLALKKLNQITSNEKHQQLQPFQRDEDYLVMKEMVTATIKVYRPHSITAKGGGVNLIRTDGVLPSSVLTSQSAALTMPTAVRFEPLICHHHGISPWQDDPKEPLALERLPNGPVLLQLFIRGNPFNGNRADQEPWGAAIQQLQRRRRLAGLVIYGSPYVWDVLVKLVEPHIPTAFSPAQTLEAQTQMMHLMLEPKGINSTERPINQGFTD